MNITKYIVFNHQTTEGVVKDEVIITFPDIISHKRMASLMAQWPDGPFSKETMTYVPIAAGYIKRPYASQPPKCYGESKELELKSRSFKDTELLLALWFV